MASLDSTERAKVALAAGEALIVTTTGQCTVQGLSGAPSSTTTLTANTQTFGPYGVSAVLLVTNVSGRTDYVADNATFPLSRTEKAAFNGLVSGAGNSGNAIIDALVEAATSAGYTWASKPNAAGNTGRVIRITDVGATSGGSHWISDGTYWRTIGQVDLVRRNKSPFSPIAQQSSGTDFLFTLPSQIILPGGMMVPGESEIDVEYAIRRSGIVGGTATARAYFGPNNSAASDFNICSANLVATDNTVQNPTCKVGARTTTQCFTGSYAQRFGTTAATGAWYDSGASAMNFAVNQYFNFGVFSPNAGDTYQLFITRVSVRI